MLRLRRLVSVAGSRAYRDPFLGLKKLVPNDEMVLSWFLGGPRKGIQNPVRMLHPWLLHETEYNKTPCTQ